MIVAVVAMWVVQMAIHDVIDMIAVRYSFMSTSRAVYMGLVMTSTMMLWCTNIRICGINI